MKNNSLPVACAPVVRSLRLSNDPSKDYRGEKNYRSVYAAEELQELYLDVEAVNPYYGLKAWKGPMTVAITRTGCGKTGCILERKFELDLEKDESEVIFSDAVPISAMPEGRWEQGDFRVSACVDGQDPVCTGFSVMEGGGRPEEYFRLVHVGLDKVFMEEPVDAGERPHSFRMFDLEGMKNLRLYLVALNLLDREWTYEFSVRVTGMAGRLMVERRVVADHYVQDGTGGSMLCFGLDLLAEGNGLPEGNYRLEASAFGTPLFALEFAVGHKDIAYGFEEEILQGAAGNPPTRTVTEPIQRTDSREEIMDRLYRLVGLRKVKEEITQIMEYADFVRLRKENGFSDTYPSMHMTFAGHPGTGKKTVAEMVGELYCTMGLLSNGKVSHFRRMDFVREGSGQEEELLRQALKDCEGGIMFIDDAGDLFCPDDRQDRGIVVLGLLHGILVREKPEVLVILADVKEEMDLLLAALPELGKIFTRHLSFEDYTPEELMEIARLKLERMQYRFSPSAEEKFLRQLAGEATANAAGFTNGRYVDRRLEEAAMKMSRRLMSGRSGDCSREDLMLITEDDLGREGTEDPARSLEKLSTIVGHDRLKQNMLQHLNYVYFIRERQKHGFDDRLPVLNMIFCGNPGTGKMTVAKMMAEIYHSLGILQRQNLIVQDARTLSADPGLPADNVASSLMDMAAGGMLYVDHADAFLQNSYGLDILEGILSCLPLEECGGTVVVLGGYPDRMAGILQVRPGLKEYFPYRFNFNDYTPEELMEIAECKLKEKKYIFHPKAKEVFGRLVEKAFETRNKNFGNVLLIEKLVDLSIRNMSERTMKIRLGRELTRQEITTIRVEDIPVDYLDIPRFGKDLFDEGEIGEALEDLSRMVGQEGIKRQIADFVDLARHYSEEGVKLGSRLSLQWCFTGNSAMGKGSVARIIARLYKAMGIISDSHLVDFQVERMTGMTEDEAQRCIGEALARSTGGILLFDEDSPKISHARGFRERVKAILMNQMAERPGAYMVFYAEPRNRVPALNGNAEHLSELMNVLDFEDYSPDELMLILKRRLDKEHMRMTAGARQYMAAFIGTLVATEERSHASSRLMRIVGDMIVRNCLQRIARTRRESKVSATVSVRKQDVGMFTEDFVAGLMKERKRIGFV